jgi:hypothetical protein
MGVGAGWGIANSQLFYQRFFWGDQNELGIDSFSSSLA